MTGGMCGLDSYVSENSLYSCLPGFFGLQCGVAAAVLLPTRVDSLSLSPYPPSPPRSPPRQLSGGGLGGGGARGGHYLHFHSLFA